MDVNVSRIFAIARHSCVAFSFRICEYIKGNFVVRISLENLAVNPKSSKCGQKVFLLLSAAFVRFHHSAYLKAVRRAMILLCTLAPLHIWYFCSSTELNTIRQGAFTPQRPSVLLAMCPAHYHLRSAIRWAMSVVIISDLIT
jgi:hypothetical protein